MVPISVIIPVRDRPMELARAVESVVQQSYPILELIIVDDGSAPPISLAGLSRGCVQTLLLRHKEPKGPAAARRNGVEHATGDLIAFLDSDDQWDPLKLERQVAIWEAHGKLPLMAISCGWQHIDLNSSRVSVRVPSTGQRLVQFASGCWFMPGSTVLLPRAAFEIVGQFDPRLRRLEDLEWYLRFGLAGGLLMVAQFPGATIYRDRTNARYSDVCSAAKIIAREYIIARKLTSLRHRMRLRAWLDAELAAINFQHRKALRGLFYLARSFALVPRTHLPLDRWWKPMIGISPNNSA
jgi:glycosyltransferase involved in cell wall biosynthesis